MNSSTIISPLATVMMTLSLLFMLVGGLLYYRTISQWITAPVVRKKTGTVKTSNSSNSNAPSDNQDNQDTPHPQIHFALGICMWTAINGAWNLTDESDQKEWRWLTVASVVANTFAWFWLLRTGMLSEWMKLLNLPSWMFSILAVPILLNIALLWFRLIDILPHTERGAVGPSGTLTDFSKGLEQTVEDSLAQLSPTGAKMGKEVKERLTRQVPLVEHQVLLNQSM